METDNFLSRVGCFIVDMDGTFYLGDTLLPGAEAFVDAVKKTGRKYFFYTNNSSHNEAECIERLNRLGYPAKMGDVVISSHVTIDFLKRNRPGKKVYLLGNENLTGDFIDAGVPMTDTDPDVVVLGFDTTLTYEKINRAAGFIARGAEYIATHPDANCPVKGGFMTDVGSFMAMFRASAGRDPDLIMGKPYGFTVDYMMHNVGCRRDELAFIGDRLETDVAIGEKNGIASILVFSGVTSPEMYAASPYRATAAVENIGVLAEMILEAGPYKN